MAAVVALVVVVVGAIAWGQMRDGLVYGGPLDAGGGIRTCIDAKRGATLTLGGDMLRNLGHSKLRITDVNLNHAHGLRLVDSHLVLVVRLSPARCFDLVKQTAAAVNS